MPIVMISMVISETSNYMNVMIVQNVLKNQCMNFNSKQTKIMKNYNWEYFKSQINKSFQNQKQKYLQSKKIDVEPVLDL